MATARHDMQHIVEEYISSITLRLVSYTLFVFRGLEKAMGSIPSHGEEQVSEGTAAQPGGQPTPPSPRDFRRVMMRGQRARIWRRMSVIEQDCLVVLSAMCKVRVV